MLFKCPFLFIQFRGKSRFSRFPSKKSFTTSTTERIRLPKVQLVIRLKCFLSHSLSSLTVSLFRQFDLIIWLCSVTYLHYQPLLVANQLGESPSQCDQMATLFFHTCPFVAKKMCPIAFENFQRRCNIWLNIKLTHKQLPKTFKMLALWQSKFRQIWSHWSPSKSER